MKPHRVRMTHNLVVNYGLYRKLQVFRPRLVSPVSMTRFHSDDYINFLRRIAPDNMQEHIPQLQRFNLGEDCPVFDGLFDYCQLYTSGSLGGADRINQNLTDSTYPIIVSLVALCSILFSSCQTQPFTNTHCNARFLFILTVSVSQRSCHQLGRRDAQPKSQRGFGVWIRKRLRISDTGASKKTQTSSVYRHGPSPWRRSGGSFFFNQSCHDGLVSCQVCRNVPRFRRRLGYRLQGREKLRYQRSAGGRSGRRFLPGNLPKRDSQSNGSLRS